MMLAPVTFSFIIQLAKGNFQFFNTKNWHKLLYIGTS